MPTVLDVFCVRLCFTKCVPLKWRKSVLLPWIKLGNGYATTCNTHTQWIWRDECQSKHFHLLQCWIIFPFFHLINYATTQNCSWKCCSIDWSTDLVKRDISQLLLWIALKRHSCRRMEAMTLVNPDSEVECLNKTVGKYIYSPPWWFINLFGDKASYNFIHK